MVYLFASAGTLVPDGQVVQKGQLMASTAGQALLYFAGVLESGTPGLVLLRRQGGQTVDLSLADFGPHRGGRPESARDLAVVPPEATTQELSELLGTPPLEFASPPVAPSMFTEAIPVFVGGQPFVGISPAVGTTVLAVTPGVIDITEVADESGSFSNIFILGADGTSIRYMLTGSSLVVDGDSVVVGQELATVGEAPVPIEVDGGGRYRLLVGGQDAAGYPISITPDSFLPK